MKIKAIAPGLGSKRQMAQRIVKELGPHKHYVSAFGGSLAVELAKPRVSLEMVYDLNGDWTNLAKVLADDDLHWKLMEKLNRTMLSEQLHKEAVERWKKHGRGQYAADPDLSRAYDFFLTGWLGLSGTIGAKKAAHSMCVRHSTTGGSPSVRFRNAVESIPAWHQRLSGVFILCRDVLLDLPKVPDEFGTAIYADPPYVVEGKQYIHSFTEEQHRELAKQLRRFREARVVVSYYDHPLVRELYDGWTFHEISVAKNMANANGKPAKAPEVLIVNEQQPSLFE